MNKTENKFICRSFIETAYDKKTKESDTIFYTVVYKNGHLRDVLEPTMDKMVNSVSSLLENKEETENIQEIQFKLLTLENVEVVNKIEIC